MILWVVLAVVAQALSAFSVFIDKYVLVAKTGIRHPTAYAFYTAMLSSAVLILVPFGVVEWPTVPVAFFSLCAAILYVSSLIFLYRALRNLSVTDVIPITGAVSALATGVLATVWLAHDIPFSLLPAFVLLTLGTFMIYCFCFPWGMLLTAIAAGALGGASTFMLKFIFESTPFWNALFWPLIMNVIVALIMIAPIRWRSIQETFHESSSNSKGLVVLSKTISGVAAVCIFGAIALGSVTIVNAMSGLQLIFILIFAGVFAHHIPHVFQAEMRVDRLVLKIAGTVAIIIGLGALFLPII
jgi:drug/metabolite transporter (DMT)-like permease